MSEIRTRYNDIKLFRKRRNEKKKKQTKPLRRETTDQGNILTNAQIFMGLDCVPHLFLIVL